MPGMEAVMTWRRVVIRRLLPRPVREGAARLESLRGAPAKETRGTRPCEGVGATSGDARADPAPRAAIASGQPATDPQASSSSWRFFPSSA